jgi:hypothetical protein
LTGPEAFDTIRTAAILGVINTPDIHLSAGNCHGLSGRQGKRNFQRGLDRAGAAYLAAISVSQNSAETGIFSNYSASFFSKKYITHPQWL